MTCPWTPLHVTINVCAHLHQLWSIDASSDAFSFISALLVHNSLHCIVLTPYIVQSYHIFRNTLLCGNEWPSSFASAVTNPYFPWSYQKGFGFGLPCLWCNLSVCITLILFQMLFCPIHIKQTLKTHIEMSIAGHLHQLRPVHIDLYLFGAFSVWLCDMAFQGHYTEWIDFSLQFKWCYFSPFLGFGLILRPCSCQMTHRFTGFISGVLYFLVILTF